MDFVLECIRIHPKIINNKNLKNFRGSYNENTFPNSNHLLRKLEFEEVLKKRMQSTQKISKVLEQDEYIKRKLITKYGGDFKDIEINHTCGKMSLSMAMILDRNKQMYLQCYKTPEDINAKCIKKLLSKVVKKYGSKLKGKS